MAVLHPPVPENTRKENSAVRHRVIVSQIGMQTSEDRMRAKVSHT